MSSSLWDRLGDARWVLCYLFLALGAQLALLMPELVSGRVILRATPFLASAALIALRPPRRWRLHPSAKIAPWIVLIVAFALFHPEGSTWSARVAHLALYVAVLSPLMWVAGLRLTPFGIRAIILTLWAFNSLSAAVGVLQMNFPGRFEPALSPIYVEGGDVLTEGSKITLANGEQAHRPMGLSDMPGAAASAGLYAVVFGLGLLLNERRLWLRAIYVASMIGGLFCIYLSQVRSLLVMAAIAMSVFVFIMARRGDVKNLISFAVSMAIVVVVGTVWAFAVGGEMTIDRLRTLVEDDPAAVYAQNRGFFLAYTWYVAIPEYPLGAGLGRWGMMNYYFGDPRAADSLYAEIQWTGWVYDGGVPLMIVYAVALGVALWIAWRIGTDRCSGRVGLWGAVLFGYNVAAVAVTFSYPLFQGQGGLEFWLLNAALYCAWRTMLAEQTAPPSGGGAGGPPAPMLGAAGRWTRFTHRWSAGKAPR